MKTKKVVLRSCCQTREVLEKKDLIRVVRTPDGEVLVDTVGKVNGRGAYLKKDETVVLQAKKSKVLDKKLEVSVPDSVYDNLIEVIHGQDTK